MRWIVAAGAPAATPGYSIEREHEDVAAVVDDIAETSGARVSVYGHSSGGICAFGAALLTANIDLLVVYEGWPPATADLWNASPTFIERMEALLEAGEPERVVETIARELAGLSEEELDATGQIRHGLHASPSLTPSPARSKAARRPPSTASTRPTSPCPQC